MDAPRPDQHVSMRPRGPEPWDRTLPPHPTTPCVFGPYNCPPPAPPLCGSGCRFHKGHAGGHLDHQGIPIDQHGFPLPPVGRLVGACDVVHKTVEEMTACMLGAIVTPQEAETARYQDLEREALERAVADAMIRETACGPEGPKVEIEFPKAPEGAFNLNRFSPDGGL